MSTSEPALQVGAEAGMVIVAGVTATFKWWWRLSPEQAEQLAARLIELADDARLDAAGRAWSQEQLARLQDTDDEAHTEGPDAPQ